MRHLNPTLHRKIVGYLIVILFLAWASYLIYEQLVPKNKIFELTYDDLRDKAEKPKPIITIEELSEQELIDAGLIEETSSNNYMHSIDRPKNKESF